MRGDEVGVLLKLVRPILTPPAPRSLSRAAFEAIVSGTLRRSRGIGADVADDALFDHTIARAAESEIAPPRFTSAWEKLLPSGGVFQLAWANVRPRRTRWWTKVAFGRLALNLHERVDARRDHYRALRIFAGMGYK